MWKTIKKYPTYQINEKGEIRREETKKILKPSNTNGHKKVILCGHTEYVSRLVAETFLRKRKERKEVHHINHDIEDNRLENLRWANHKEIQTDLHKSGAYSKGGALPAKKIKVLETGMIYYSIKSCAKDLKIRPNQIRQCLKNPEKSIDGKHFVLL